MEIILLPGETMEDLLLGGLKLIQKKKGFRFGVDAVVLADFARLCAHAVAVDLCSGSGIISLLLCHHYAPKRIDAVELQPEYAALASRNVLLNGLSETISVFSRDLREAAGFLPCGAYDAVVCNPPYKKMSAGVDSPQSDVAIARSEVFVTIDDIAKVSSKLLRFGGKLYLVHRPQRLDELFTSLSNCRLTVKRLRFVASRADVPPSLVLIEAVLGAKPGLIVEAQHNVFDADGGESTETKRIYRRKQTEEL